jgi:hypothetical protein
MERMREMRTIRSVPAPSSVRGAETTGDTRAEISFRNRAADVHAAVEQAIDQCADDLRAVQHLAALCADVRRKPVEVVNLSIEEND